MSKAIVTAAIAASLAAIQVSCPAQATAKDAERLLADFAAALKANPAISSERKQRVAAFLRDVQQSPEGREAAITESLKIVYPEFGEALAAVGEGDSETARLALTKLRQSSDPYLAAAATFHLAKSLLLVERFEDATPLLADLEGKWSDKIMNGGEVLFSRGIVEAALLKPHEGARALTKFLTEFPEAPERLRDSATRLLQQLRQIQEGTLGDVQLRMDYSRRRLANEDTGVETQQQQHRIVELLDGLIESAQQRESKPLGGGSGKSQKQGHPGAAQGQIPGVGSQVDTTGGGSKGVDSDAVNRLTRGGPQSPWSKLRDKERNPVYSAIKEKFPARYQQLIEQYYKSFQDDDER